MSRRSVKKRILGASLIALVLALVYLYVATVPVYPAFQKEVQSSKTLHRVLANYPDIIIPQIDPSFYVYEYLVNLDGRTRLSKPIGFHICATSDYGNHSMNHHFNCTSRDEYVRPDILYREVPIQFFNDKAHKCISSVKFTLEGRLYEFEIIHDILENENPEIDQWIEEQLVGYAQQVIDRALGASESELLST